MKSIQVSTEVYAAIWSNHQSGEDSEDAILRRILKVRALPAKKPSNNVSNNVKIGFIDARYGIELPEGFEIFRTYLGVEYRAKAMGGKWLLLTTGKAYPSLNQLSRAIGTSIENAWQNWYYLGPDGKRHLITSLRKNS